jgi:hypothetical protein
MHTSCLRLKDSRTACLLQACPSSNSLAPHTHWSLLLLLLQVSKFEAERIAGGELQRLIAQKRLILVLDLDHTLLNTGVCRTLG